MKSSLLDTKTTSVLSTRPKPQKLGNVKAKAHDKSCSSRKIKSARKCRVCGNDPYPNYFFCQTCHQRVGIYEDYE